MARSLRSAFPELAATDEFPKTGCNAYTCALLVAEQVPCTFQEAMMAVQEVFPEHFADYWESKWETEHAK